jgi:hypothetical protein
MVRSQGEAAQATLTSRTSALPEISALPQVPSVSVLDPFSQWDPWVPTHGCELRDVEELPRSTVRFEVSKRNLPWNPTAVAMISASSRMLASPQPMLICVSPEFRSIRNTSGSAQAPEGQKG